MKLKKDYSPEERILQQRDHDLKMTELTFRSEGVLQQIRQIEVSHFLRKFNSRFHNDFRLSLLSKKNVKISIDKLRSALMTLFHIGP